MVYFVWHHNCLKCCYCSQLNFHVKIKLTKQDLTIIYTFIVIDSKSVDQQAAQDEAHQRAKESLARVCGILNGRRDTIPKGTLTLNFITRNFSSCYWKNKIKMNLTFKISTNQISNFGQKFNPQMPDRFTPSRARCAENCGSLLTYRWLGKNRYLFYIQWCY